MMAIPVTVVAALFLLPYLRYDKVASGVWFISYRGRKAAIVSMVVAMIATPLGIVADEFIIDFAAWMPAVPAVVSNGLLPAAFVLASVIGFYRLMKNKFALANNEAYQAVFILLLGAFIILTVTGIGFRGSGMALMWSG